MSLEEPKKVYRKTSFIIIERQIWPQPQEDTHPYWCYVNTLQFHDNKTNKVVWEQKIPEADLSKNWNHFFSVGLRKDNEPFGWILIARLSHEKAKFVMPLIYNKVKELTP